MKVQYSNICPANWKCGDIVEDKSMKQYSIVDAEQGFVTLKVLQKDEHIKRELILFNLK